MNQPLDPERYRAPEILYAVMHYLRHELERAFGNTYQEWDEERDEPIEPPMVPMRGGGEPFQCSAFSVRPFDESEDYRDEKGVPCNAPNFVWQDGSPEGVKIWWHKHATRGLDTERPLTNDEIARLCAECSAAIHEWEDEQEREQDRLEREG